MPDGVLDRDGAALGHGQQREPPETGMVGNRLQIGESRLHRMVGDIALGQSVAALVEADDGRDVASSTR